MQSDLGPVIGSIAPMQPIEKPYRFDDGCAAMRAAALVVRILAFGFAAACIAALVLVTVARAQQHHHHHHAFYQNWVNKDGKGCCNDRDCAELAAHDEREIDGMLQVRVEGQWCEVETRHYLRKGNVPNAAVSHACVIPQKAEPTLGPCQRFICYQPQPRS